MAAGSPTTVASVVIILVLIEPHLNITINAITEAIIMMLDGEVKAIV